MTRVVDTSALSGTALAQAEAALASLPVSFRAGSPAATAIVSGADGWPAEVRRAGASTVLVLDPVACADATVDGVDVVLVERFAGNPALAGGIRLPAEIGGVVVQVTSPGGDPDALVLEAVRALRSAGLAEITLDVAVRSASSVLVEGTADGGRLSIVAADGRVPELRIEVVGAAAQASVRLHDGTAAWPAHVSFTDDSGTAVRPTEYENAFRAALRSGSTGSDLDAFAADVALVDGIRADG